MMTTLLQAPSDKRDDVSIFIAKDTCLPCLGSYAYGQNIFKITYNIFVGLFPLVMSLVTYLCWGQPLVGGG